MERLKRGREGGWEVVTIFGGLSGGRDGGEGGYRCKPGGLLFGREFFNEFLMFDFGKGIKLFH